MTDDRFTLDDVIRAGGCATGVRAWFTARAGDLPEGVTLRTFLREGMSLDEALSCHDGFIERALRIKEARHGR